MADPVYDLAMRLVRLQVMSALEGVAPAVTEAAADSLLRHCLRLAPVEWRARLPHQVGNILQGKTNDIPGRQST